MKQTTKRHPLRHILGGLLLAGAIFGGTVAHAQTSVKWQQALGSTNQAEYFRDVAIDGEGNMYMVGSFQGTANFTFPGPLNFPLVSAGGYDIVIAKYDRAGTLLWVERGGGPGNDYGNSIAIHTDANGAVDNVFTTGLYAAASPTFTGSADLITVSIPALSYAGGEDIYTSVHSTTGVCKLLRSDGGPGNDKAQGIAVEQRPGNIFSVYTGGIIENNAFFNPFGAITTALKDGYVIRYGYNNTAVSLTPAANAIPFSSAGNDQIANVGIHVTGELYAVGAYEGTMSLGGSSVPTSLTNSGLADAFVVRLNSLATIVLSGNRVSGAGGDYGMSLTFDRNNNIYVCGYYAGAATTLDAGMTLPAVSGSRDFWVGKLITNGVGGINFIVIQKGGSINDDRAYDMIADNCGDRIFIAGMVGTGYGAVSYGTSGIILPWVSGSKLNGMLLQLDRNLANPVAYFTYGATVTGVIASSLHEAMYGIAINNVGDIGLAGVTSGSNNTAPGSSNVLFLNSASTVLMSTPTVNCNNGTADLNYNFYMSSIDMSQWPATATLPAASCMATGKGIAMRDCIVYEGGDYSNTASTAGMTIGGATFGGCNQDAYLVKYDLYGNPLGGTRVTVSHPVAGNALVSDICTSQSPAYPDVYECGAVDSDVTGSLTIAGFLSTLTGFPTSQHLFLASYADTPASSFVPNWRVYDATGMSSASDVCTDFNGDIFLTGVYSTAMTLVHNGTSIPIAAPAFPTMYIMKINPAGTIQWFNGTVAVFPVFPNGISCVNFNTPIVVGQSDNGTDYDAFIATFDNATGALITNYSPATAPSDQAVNEISVGESGTIFAITGTFSGTFAFGATPAITATGSPANMFVAMYSIPSLAWLWSRDEGDMGLGTIGADVGFRDQSVVVTGSYQNGAQFNGIAQTSAGSWDIYWARYNAVTGAMINVVNTAGGAGPDNGMAIINLNGALPEADQFGNCALACGHFFSPAVTFGTITATNPSGPGAPNLFITKINSQSSVFSQRLGAPVDEEPAADGIDAAASLDVLAMPNPFSESTVVRIDGAVPANTVLKLYDVSGRLMQEPILVTGNAVTLDGSLLENGIYIYTLEAGETSLYTGKLMIQH